MKSKYWLVLGLIALGATQATACSSKFASCADSRTCAPDSAEAQGGQAGQAQGEAGASTVGTSDSAGEGGEGGEGGAQPGPVLFGACSVLGSVVCEGVGSPRRLACDGRKWQADTTCAYGQACVAGAGDCAPLVDECVGAEPGQVVCRGDKPLTCGPDLVTADEGQACEGVCKDGVCQTPTCGDMKIEAGEDCDDGDATNSGACAKCKAAICGDGSVFVGHEECDDNNNVAGDGCSPTCTWEPIAVAAGDAATCALSAAGTVKCWGDNSSGALGLGDTTNRGDDSGEMGINLPVVALGANRKAKAISCATAEACAVLDNGDLKCWGNNAFGQLGTGDQDSRGDQAREMGDALKPVALGVGRTALSVSQGGFHTCAVLDNGDSKCWGSNIFGQLGQGNLIDESSAAKLSPINLGSGRTAKAVSAGVGFSTCAILDDGSGKCWGTSQFYSLSVDSSENAGAFTDPFSIGDDPGDMVLLRPLNLGGGHTIKAIGAGSISTCALLDDGTVKCWGSNNDGQLGQDNRSAQGYVPSLLPNVPPVFLGSDRKARSISVGASHVCAVLDNGDVKCWGANARGQLGIGSTDDQGDDPGEMAALKPVPLGRKALQVSAGREHTCALLDNGRITCWGLNDTGQLGVGDRVPRGNTGGLAGVLLQTVDVGF